MNELSKQAFETNNFDLSAEILERSLIEDGPSVERYLCLGDSYARGGQLEKAFAAYSKSTSYGTVIPSRLHHLVSSLVDTMAQKDETMKLKERAQGDIFVCLICKSLWTDPISLKCGHTFCRACLLKDESTTCKSCGISHKREKIPSIKTNVLLVQTVEKWFPLELKAIQLKTSGTKCFQEGRYNDAVDYFTQALEHAPQDHLLVSNRSVAFACLHRYDEALKDAEQAISIRPDWPKGYFRKGAALSGLEEHEKAAYALLQCLSLDQGVQTARDALCKSLHKILSPIEAEEHFKIASSRNAYFQRTHTSYPLFSRSLSVGSLEDLKHSLQDSLIKAGGLKKSTEKSDEAAATSADASAAACAASFSTFNVTEPSMPLFDLTKCSSLPSSSNSSPLMPRLNKELKRSPSDQEIHRSDSGSRKRSNQDHLKKDTSPTRCSTPSKQSRSEGYREVALELRDKDDFECALCMRLLHMPVTTPCGHAFCRQCLDRVLDHSPQCPLCKSSLVEYLAERRSSVTEALEKLLMIYFPAEYEERKIQHEEDLAELARMGSEQQCEVPIFVCTLAFPQLPCPLHVFEPRYRLMIRQVMEAGTRQFGMCMAAGDTEASFSEWGTMLEIRDVQYFPDGRSVVDCMGGRRFRVRERTTRDGYNTAKVEFISDQQPANAEEAQALLELHNRVHSEATKWFLSIGDTPRAQIVKHLGAFPAVEQNPLSLPHGPTWHWWLCAVLPLDPRAQTAVLAMSSLQARLQALTRVLQFVQRRGGAGGAAH